MPLLFCPTCSNLLTISSTPSTSTTDPTEANANRMECRTCPYQYVIKKRYYERKVFKHVDTDDIIGGKDEWENAQKTKIGCPREGCKGDEAAYYSVQIRSADEPMTNFYQCMTCHKEWRD